MRKILVLILAALLLVCVMCGCGKSEDEEANKPPVQSADVKEPEESEAVSEEDDKKADDKTEKDAKEEENKEDKLIGSSGAVKMTAAELGKFQNMFSYGSWFARALSSEYAKPADVSIRGLFYDGMPTMNYDYTESELSFLNDLYGENAFANDIFRYPAKDVDSVLQQCFGLSLSQTNMVDASWFHYFAETDCYYNMHGDAMGMKVNFDSGYKLPDGSVQLYYDNIITYPGGKYVVTLVPAGSGYHIQSNLPA